MDDALDGGLLDAELLGDRLLALVALVIAWNCASRSKIYNLEDLPGVSYIPAAAA